MSLIRKYKIYGNIPQKIHYACELNVFKGWLNVDGFNDALLRNFSEFSVIQEIAQNAYKMDFKGDTHLNKTDLNTLSENNLIQYTNTKNYSLSFEFLRSLKAMGHAKFELT